MSLILTSQKSNEPNSRPYDYQNYFTSTMKIAKGSKIALNHVTINRNAFFNFTEDKVFFIYHGVEMPDTEFKMKDMLDSSGAKNALLEDTTSVLSVKEINNYVNYPQPVIVPKGEYSVAQLTEKLEYILNNPSANYGGDFYRAGHWTVKANYNDKKVFENISFDWDTSTNDITSAFPPDASFLKKYSGYDNISYSQSSENVATTTTDWNGGEWDRFISNHNGTFRVDITGNNQIAGLTRVTDGETYQEYGDYVYQSNGDKILDCPRGLDFFDYAVASDSLGNFKVFILEATKDSSGVSGGRLEMVEYDYGTPISTYSDSYVEFTVENNNVKIVLFASGVIAKTITKELKPIGNTTYQLVPKIAIKGKTTVSLGAAPKLLSDTNKPIYPSLVAAGTTDFSDCNIWHICHNIWRMGNLILPGTNLTDISNTYLYRMFDSIMGYSAIDSDDDAQNVQDDGQSITIAEMDLSGYNFFWSYEFDETLNTNAGGFKYQYLPPVATKEYTFDEGGTVIIHYSLKNSLYHVKGTLDGAIGITPKFRKGVEEDVGGNQVIQILGSNRIALNNNDILYVRIDLGNGYTMNGATSSVSKIISPILTDTSDAEIGTSLGIRTYTPERMYLDLNNAEDLYINSINVSIVTKGERYAIELAPSTSASFHIIPPNK
jgi:hypothetical protein